MVILPRERPVIQGLNSYYLDVRRLFEHYQGELGSGAVHFHSPSSEGVVFFDKDELLSGIFQGKDGEPVKGGDAVDKLIDLVEEQNFTLSVYAIDLDKVYFWANIPAAETIFRDLSTEFTDLEGLINKMASEKLTGYIEVLIKDGGEGGLIFFIHGKVIGGSYSWVQGELNGSRESLDLLIRKTKESGGTFNVSRISPDKRGETSASQPDSPPLSEDVIAPLEELLELFERTVQTGKFVKGDFGTALKKKFVEMADTYAFLDPFACEFTYSNHRVSYTGSAAHAELFRGVVDSIKELAQEIGAWSRFSTEIGPWKDKYAGMLTRFGITL